MKKIHVLLAFFLTLAAEAQTLSVTVGNVTYQFPASQTGDMIYADGTMLTIMDKVFSLSEIASMKVDDSIVADNTVNVSYSGTSASVTISGNVAQYLTVSQSGAHVSISQSDNVAEEITYVLSGTSTDGEFSISGSWKTTIELNGLNLTNKTPVYSGSAINIANSKRIQIVAKKDTENTLSDCASGSQQACLYAKGQLQLQGNGTLNVVGNAKHGIKSASYVSIKNLTLNITSAASDGINCEEYMQMKSGTLTIGNVGDDCIQCDLGSTSSTGETIDHEDEDTGNVYFEGGTLNVAATAAAAKCVKAGGDIRVSDGTLVLYAMGAIDLTDPTDASTTAGFKADGDFVQHGGNVYIYVTGNAGRGIAVDGTLTTAADNTGSLYVENKGAISSSSSGTGSSSAYFYTAQGLKAGNVQLNGGTVEVVTTGAASKGIKADEGNMSIAGGSITVSAQGTGAVNYSKKDAKGCAALNADGNLLISGGVVTLKSTGSGGKCINVDGTLTIEDGTLSAIATGSRFSSGSYSTSAKAVKCAGAMLISGGSVVASASSHEAIESKSTLDITGGYVYANSSDDAINSASHMTISGGYVMGSSTGNDGLDANGNLYIKGGNVVAVSARSPEVALDANTEKGYALYISGGNVMAIGGLERGSTISNGTAYQASSYSKGAWYGLFSGDGSLAFAVKVPSNSSMGTPMVVYTTGTAVLKSGVTGSGTSFWSENGYSNCSGGSTVTLSSYSSGSSGGGPGGHGGHGGW